MTYDAIIVGAGPNGLAAAITLARAGCKVLVYEAAATVGGGMRSAELTLPGFVHDICSAVHPMGLASPFFRSLPQAELGLEWVHPTVPLAHPLDDGTAVVLDRSIDRTAEGLGLRDASAYRRLLRPLVERWQPLLADLLAPLRWPGDPLLMARFGLAALWPAAGFARHTFEDERAQALFAGCAAHSIMPLERPSSAAIGLALTLVGHAVGWPVARGGSQSIANALERYLRQLGGEIMTGTPVTDLRELPPARAILLDVTPKQMMQLAGERLPGWYRSLLINYRYGPGVFKVDYALDGPIPWRAAACAQAGTVHIGGTLAEIAAGERATFAGQQVERPYVLLAQQSLFDSTRAPAGKQTAWAYCHVPNGSTVDMTARIEAQIERFAPGFGERILARAVRDTAGYQAYNANYIGGDINGGVQDLGQLYTRPVPWFPPYATPSPGLYICSTSTPPGGGVHGMCGYWAAQTALKRM